MLGEVGHVRAVVFAVAVSWEKEVETRHFVRI